MSLVMGVISDTHGLLRSEAISALSGSDLILHAGDVGAPEILDELARIAPVKVVRGNIDQEPWTERLPLVEVVEAGDLSIYMLHDLKLLDLNPVAAGFAAVVCGHSHKPMNELRNGVLYFNPASAGPRRFRLPVCVGRIVVEKQRLRGEIIPLKLPSHL